MSSRVKTPWMQVLSVTPLEDFRLNIALDSGVTFVFDMKEIIHSRDAYWRLRQMRYFNMVSIDEAGALCWPEGEDIAPEALERYAATLA